MLAVVMPPTGSSKVSRGSTARSALTAAGGIISAGNSLSPAAPASSAANASVAVNTPGRQTMPSATAWRTTSALKLGDDDELPAGVMHFLHLPGW